MMCQVLPLLLLLLSPSQWSQSQVGIVFVNHRCVELEDVLHNSLVCDVSPGHLLVQGGLASGSVRVHIGLKHEHCHWVVIIGRQHLNIFQWPVHIVDWRQSCYFTWISSSELNIMSLILTKLKVRLPAVAVVVLRYH